MGAIIPLASSCGNPATKLESGDQVFTRQAYIDLSDVPAKVSVNAIIEGEITRAMLGSRIVVSTDKLGYRDGVLTLDTSVLYNEDGELAISSGEQTLRLYTSSGTVDIEILLVNKVLRTAEDILDLNDAQTLKDEAKQKHIEELYYYWYYFYNIRSLTLFDFMNNCNLDAEFEKIVRK